MTEAVSEHHLKISYCRPCIEFIEAKTSAMAKKSAAKLNTGEIVLSAIKKLMKNTGWTARTIVKFIRMEYGLNSPAESRKVSRALKKGVRLGLLRMDSGRYRLNDMSRLARPVTARELRARPRERDRKERGVRMRSRSRTPSHRDRNNKR